MCASSSQVVLHVFVAPFGVNHCCTLRSIRIVLGSTARSTTNLSMSDDEIVAYSMHVGIAQFHHTTPASQEIETTSKRTLAGARFCWRRRRTTSRWYIHRPQFMQKRLGSESSHS